MSLVLQEEHAGIAAELKQALNPDYEGEGVCRKIVFAAAGNCGANDLTPWPANMDGMYTIGRECCALTLPFLSPRSHMIYPQH